uniref:Uncharacterized protein n=1 Tax=Onchocerca volvulus TaxID=6282 RepID=A0A2K6VUA7_ONCVO
MISTAQATVQQKQTAVMKRKENDSYKRKVRQRKGPTSCKDKHIYR